MRVRLFDEKFGAQFLAGVPSRPGVCRFYDPAGCWPRLLGRPVSEPGRLCHGEGDHEGGGRCRRACRLTILTYTDAVSFAVMDALRCTVALTFDHDFLVAGFSRWTPEA